MPREAHLGLPPFYAITPPLEADGSSTPFLEQTACREWLAGFERLLETGVTLIQLRAKGLSEPRLRDLARACWSGAFAANCWARPTAAAPPPRILLNGPAKLATDLGLAGVHLTSTALMALTERPLPADYLVAASCHSPKELAHAQAIGADFACLSPVKPTKGYSVEKILGLDTFKAWVSEVDIPVYGLGGLERDDLDRVRAAGGQGVAGISAFWSSSI